MQPENVVLLKIDLLVPNPNQPRKIFNDNSLKELAISIKEYGILNPLLVRKKENSYEIIAGERRYRAAKLAGLTEVPVIIKDVSEIKAAEIALIENLQRENITPIEEATSYEEILNNSNITEQKLSELIGKSQSFISNKIRLLKLPSEIKDALNNKKISEKHARSLLTINNENEQIELLKKIIAERLSVKELDNIINKRKEEKESDNMNNGNFFPNYNTNEANSNVSLNTMNMQTMGIPNQQPIEGPVAPVNEPIVQTPVSEQTIEPSPIPQVEIQNIESNNAPTPIMPEINNNVSSPIPNFGLNTNSVVTETPQANIENISSMVQNSIEPSQQPVDIPLFNETTLPNISTPTEPVISTSQPEPSITPEQPKVNSFEQNNMIPETPLFNNDLNNTPVEPNLNESFYEVPVNVSPVIEQPTEDKFTKVEQLLSSNNIEYKAYSNETGHCIIIEL